MVSWQGDFAGEVQNSCKTVEVHSGIVLFDLHGFASTI
jgi:hypothetical protein